MTVFADAETNRVAIEALLKRIDALERDARLSASLVGPLSMRVRELERLLSLTMGAATETSDRVDVVEDRINAYRSSHPMIGYPRGNGD